MKKNVAIHILTFQATIEHPTKLHIYSHWFPEIPKFYVSCKKYLWKSEPVKRSMPFLILNLQAPTYLDNWGSPQQNC